MLSLLLVAGLLDFDLLFVSLMSWSYAIFRLILPLPLPPQRRLQMLDMRLQTGHFSLGVLIQADRTLRELYDLLFVTLVH